MTSPETDGSSIALATSSSGLAAPRFDPDRQAVEIATPVQGGSLYFEPGQKTLNDVQMAILGPIGIKRHWDPASVLAFLMDCQRRGFDPYSREAYLMEFWTSDGMRFVHHIGIAGMRRHAGETGLYGGRKRPIFFDRDMKRHEIWPYRDAVPYAVEVTMLRTDWKEPVITVAYYDEFAPLMPPKTPEEKAAGGKVPVPMWRPAAQGGKPTLMLNKCAEAAGFREAFPHKFGNWYDRAETERLSTEGPPAAETPRDRVRQAYTVANGGQVVDGGDIGATVTEPAPVDQVDQDEEQLQGGDPAQDPAPLTVAEIRDMVLAELDAQAAILGLTRADMVGKWEAGRGGARFVEATLQDMVAHVHRIRDYVDARLREQDRAEMADRYRDARPVGTLVELFGDDPREWAPGGVGRKTTAGGRANQRDEAYAGAAA